MQPNTVFAALLAIAATATAAPAPAHEVHNVVESLLPGFSRNGKPWTTSTPPRDVEMEKRDEHLEVPAGGFGFSKSGKPWSTSTPPRDVEMEKRVVRIEIPADGWGPDGGN
jgi:hypothetical protein